jgi:hypothetical protein
MPVEGLAEARRTAEVVAHSHNDKARILVVKANTGQVVATFRGAKKSNPTSKGNPLTTFYTVLATNDRGELYRVGGIRANNMTEAKREMSKRFGSDWKKKGHKIGRIFKQEENPRRATVSKGIRKMHKTFQGRDVKSVKNVLTSKHTPAQTFKLGGLSFLKIRGKAKPLRFNPNTAFLAGDARRRLHINGVRFAKPTQLSNPDQFYEYGPIEQVGYIDGKDHIDDGKVYEYVHKMGEEGGELPVLLIDFEGFPVIDGGSYDIQDVGIVD